MEGQTTDLNYEATFRQGDSVVLSGNDARRVAELVIGELVSKIENVREDVVYYSKQCDSARGFDLYEDTLTKKEQELATLKSCLEFYESMLAGHAHRIVDSQYRLLSRKAQMVCEIELKFQCSSGVYVTIPREFLKLAD